MIDLEMYPNVVKFLDQLTPEQEDRLLTRSFSAVSATIAAPEPCLVECALDVRFGWPFLDRTAEETWQPADGLGIRLQELTRTTHPRDNKFGGYWWSQFDALLWKVGAVQAVRDHIMANRLARESQAVQVAVPVAV